MTISELINHLQELDGNLEVYIQGYESGFRDVTEDRIETIEVCRDFYAHDGNWWDGDHEDAHAVGRVEYLDKYEVKKGIVFGR
jgi:hypothetical protein